MALSHQALIEGCKAHKAAAQRELYERFASKMLAVCHRYAYSNAAAEDMLQEAFVKVFQKIGDYEDRGSLEGWIRRIVVNTAIDHIRKERNLRHQEQIEAASQQEVSADVFETLETEYLFRIIRELPDGYRIVFNLYAIEGYSHAEIGAQLNITESTSRSQYARARALLMEKIRGVYQETHYYRDAI
ncbi:MAG: sigma-70 family RNA polymerase sigma factor [Bacteroidetes bacterium]|nr:MAG: sigma-70 family RNA polymerase sigma factor [Bacteroidota bacterium]